MNSSPLMTAELALLSAIIASPRHRKAFSMSMLQIPRKSIFKNIFFLLSVFRRVGIYSFAAQLSAKSFSISIFPWKQFFFTIRWQRQFNSRPFFPELSWKFSLCVDEIGILSHDIIEMWITRDEEAETSGLRKHKLLFFNYFQSRETAVTVAKPPYQRMSIVGWVGGFLPLSVKHFQCCRHSNQFVHSTTAHFHVNTSRKKRNFPGSERKEMQIFAKQILFYCATQSLALSGVGWFSFHHFDECKKLEKNRKRF